MKKIAFVTAGLLSVANPMAFAHDRGGPRDYARVIDVNPIYEQVNAPRTECYSDYVPETRYERRDGDNLAGTVIGGVAGGLLGSRFGRGGGRAASAAVGAVAGAIIGDRLSDRGRRTEVSYEREVRRCREVDNWERRITSYRVTYEYAGREYTTVLPYDPGPRLPVNVAIAPDPDGRHHDRWEH